MTTIEWTDQTWNPVTGCTKISPGCRHCYAERLFPRVYGNMMVRTIDGRNVVQLAPCVRSRPRKFSDVVCHDDRLLQPLSWRKKRKVFVCNMGDLFHDDVPDLFILKVFAVMETAQRHTFQILTKRPERMARMLSNGAFPAWVRKVGYDWLGADRYDERGPHWRNNQWIGVSAEDQKQANKRVPWLLQTPAVVRFVSLEPLLEPVHLNAIRYELGPGNEFIFDALSMRDDNVEDDVFFQGAIINWVIIGGESGPRARHSPAVWFEQIRRDCEVAGTPFFMKQLGGYPDKKSKPEDWPRSLRVREWPRH